MSRLSCSPFSNNNLCKLKDRISLWYKGNIKKQPKKGIHLQIDLDTKLNKSTTTLNKHVTKEWFDDEIMERHVLLFVKQAPTLNLLSMCLFDWKGVYIILVNLPIITTKVIWISMIILQRCAVLWQRRVAIKRKV